MVEWFDEEWSREWGVGVMCYVMSRSDLIRYEAAAESKPPTTFISNRTFFRSIHIYIYIYIYSTILILGLCDWSKGGREPGGICNAKFESRIPSSPSSSRRP